MTENVELIGQINQLKQQEQYFKKGIKIIQSEN